MVLHILYTQNDIFKFVHCYKHLQNILILIILYNNSLQTNQA
jgi:hypothetical protein